MYNSTRHHLYTVLCTHHPICLSPPTPNPFPSGWLCLFPHYCLCLWLFLPTPSLSFIQSPSPTPLTADNVFHVPLPKMSLREMSPKYTRDMNFDDGTRFKQGCVSPKLILLISSRHTYCLLKYPHYIFRSQNIRKQDQRSLEKQRGMIQSFNFLNLERPETTAQGW